MKRLLFILTITMFFGFNSYSQIQRNFFGCKLGESTKEEVYKTLKDKGASKQTMNGEKVIVLEEQRFGGVTWNTIIFKFIENRFSSAVFMLSEKEYSESANDIVIKRLLENLENKYSMYLKDKDSNKPSYSDGKTYIFITISPLNTFILGYNDLGLSFKLIESEQDEL